MLPSFYYPNDELSGGLWIMPLLFMLGFFCWVIGYAFGAW